MIAIVTDSTCDIPPEVAERENIRVVPVYVNIQDESLRDGIDIRREDFYRRLPGLSGNPKTASPAPGEFAALYEELLGKASHIVSIHIASQLSGVCQSAAVAAGQVNAGRITIIDSGQVSMGLGWAVIGAAKAARSGASLEAVLHSTQDALRRVKLYALLDTLKYLARSGRINLVRLGLSTLLNIKAIVEVRDGQVELADRVRTWSRATEALERHAIEVAPLENLAIMHTNLDDGAAAFLARLRKAIDVPEQTIIVNATTAVGTHAGPGALGIAALRAR